MPASEDAVLIDQAEVARLLSCCAKSVQRLAKSDPTFPAGFNPTGGRNCRRYSKAAVTLWAESRAAAADRERAEPDAPARV